MLGLQDFSQLKRDYGDKEATVIMSTVGNVFSGQVVGETAKTLSERFGKILQKRESVSINRSDTSTSISTQLDSLIPASKISTLSQGRFVGAVTDNFGETIEQKIFHAQIVVDNEAVQKETAAYQPFLKSAAFWTRMVMIQGAADTSQLPTNQAGYCGTGGKRTDPHRE